jgi:hypothetical protein
MPSVKALSSLKGVGRFNVSLTTAERGVEYKIVTITTPGSDVSNSTSRMDTEDTLLEIEEIRSTL